MLPAPKLVWMTKTFYAEAMKEAFIESSLEFLAREIERTVHRDKITLITMVYGVLSRPSFDGSAPRSAQVSLPMSVDCGPGRSLSRG